MGDKETKPIFEPWEEVDCEKCERWWTSSCDGVTVGYRKPCNSFLATRHTSIPLEIARLRSALKWLIRGYWVLGGMMILMWAVFGLYVRFGGW